MAKVRVLGPRDRLEDTLCAVQDLGVLQLAEPPVTDGMWRVPPAPREARRRRQVTRILHDAERALRALEGEGRPPPARGVPDLPTLAGWARVARRVSREAEALVARMTALEEERALVARYHEFLRAILPDVRRMQEAPGLVGHAVVIPAAARALLDRLATALGEGGAEGVAITARPLPGGDQAVLLVLPRALDDRLERALADARVPEVTLPGDYAGRPLAESVPRMLDRLGAIPRLLDAARREREAMARAHGALLRRIRGGCHDWLAEAEARSQAAVTRHAFAIEGWIPAIGVPALADALRGRLGATVLVETIAREVWKGEDAPVVLRNPRLFQPFEVLLRLMPLPVYGSIDPTPFMAVFFPMIFGMILGDVGYGLVLALLAMVLGRGAPAGSPRGAVARIAAPCAAFGIVFGVLYGEFFGDLGRRWFGLHPVLFDREEAVFAALGIAVALGAVHVLLGLVLGVVAARAHPRHALGRGVSALMMLLIIAALLAATHVLPDRFFTPVVIALLACFPVLVFAEGMIAPVELLATMGNVLSYARIMALGTASVMLAVVANQMVGAMGSAVVGVLFALLFHLVNFAIGLFSPAIHALRLHYVEFFGKFYSPGGHPYRPFAHWTPAGASPAGRSPS